jgi:hypothetical protein
LDANATTVADVACPAQLLVLPELDTGVERSPLEPPPPALHTDDYCFDINAMLECIPPEDWEGFS